jgi:spore coat polysaccharide biosynthesis protein SpsF
MRTVAIIQARNGSTRLPGKILADLGGMPILDWVVRAARAATLVDEVVVATSTEPADDATESAGRRLGVPVVRGPEDDVLARFQIAVRAHPADLVVRLTADCPLLDPRLIDAAISVARGPAAPDYVATTLVRTLPRGLDVEVVRTDVLAEVDRVASAHDRVHVTSYVYAHPDRFRCLGVSTLLDAADLRVTVDTAEDLAAVRAVVAVLGTDIPDAEGVVGLLRARPDLVAMNSHVSQKSLAEG